MATGNRFMGSSAYQLTLLPVPCHLQLQGEREPPAGDCWSAAGWSSCGPAGIGVIKGHSLVWEIGRRSWPLTECSLLLAVKLYPPFLHPPPKKRCIAAFVPGACECDFIGSRLLAGGIKSKL